MRLLIVEDDDRLAEIMARVFRREHFLVDCASDGETGLNLAATDTYDVVILDRMLPRIDGIALLQQLRAQRVDTPVLMLTARSEVEDRIGGLRAGADDYLGKPFSLDEVIARVEALTRRRARPISPDQEMVHDLTIDFGAATVTCNGEPVPLSPQEYQLLELLVRNRGQVVARETILDRIWGFDADPQSNVVELYIHYLRRKIARLSPESARLLETVRGLGYRLRNEPA